jgi:hypothetical protein
MFRYEAAHLLLVRSKKWSRLPAKAGKVLKPIETSRFPDPIIGRHNVDREEKRVTPGSGPNEIFDRNSLTSTIPIREDSHKIPLGRKKTYR